jgi:hypothetical protein
VTPGPPYPAVWAPAGESRYVVDLVFALRVARASRPVTPDGRAGLVWLSNGTLHACGPESRPWRPDRPGTDVLGIRLALGAAPAVLGVPAREVADRRVPLDRLWGRPAAQLAERMTATASPAEREQLLLTAIRDHAGDGPVVSPVTHAIARRLAAPDSRVRDLARHVGLSERQLRRHCDIAFG